MKLPPLKALPVFEAVARLNSFSLAAEELSVGQSAVSHQIKLLETYLGESLFTRTGRYLALTDEGRQYFDAVSTALLQIERASEQLLGQDTARLRLSWPIVLSPYDRTPLRSVTSCCIPSACSPSAASSTGKPCAVNSRLIQRCIYLPGPRSALQCWRATHCCQRTASTIGRVGTGRPGSRRAATVCPRAAACSTSATCCWRWRRRAITRVSR